MVSSRKKLEKNNSGRSGSGENVSRWVNFVLAWRLSDFVKVLWRRRRQKFYNCKTRILLSWQSLCHGVWPSCTILYKWQDQRLFASSQPYYESSLPQEVCWPHWTKAMSMTQLLCIWQPECFWHWAEGGIVLVGWWVHDATQFHFKVSFKCDTVDAMNVVNQAVHRKRTRDWRRSNRYWGHMPSWDGV